ncbi:MAG: metallophosphoesterase [Oscillospiraceae bacterium]|jgi:predicted phosphohydrolase
MALYTIGDLHLSFGADKPMDVFGKAWQNHVQRLREGFAALSPEDLTVICGDLSWGMDLAGSREDFLFIDRLPGRKIVLKGNHDYWWTTATKAKTFFAENGITTIDILNNNCFFYGNIALCGTRGWFYEEETGSDHDKKIMARELMRLETSLKAAGEREKYVFLHYPPIYGNYVCEEILELFRQYSVTLCCAGHIHGKGQALRFEGERDGTRFRLVSSDFLGFRPLRIAE